MDALIWFNGPSQADWLHLPAYPLEIGCNYFADVRPVHHICCFDDRMKSAIIKKPGINYWCRNGHSGNGWNEVTYPMTEEPQNSGLMAVKLAIDLGCARIRIVGCDWGRYDYSVFESRYLNATPGKKYDNHSRSLLKKWSMFADIAFVSSFSLDVPVAHLCKIDL
jgi:hypothetical protein